MSNDKLIQLLETYSNAILGFLVLQSVAFSFTYGTNSHFSCLIDNQRLLAPGLIAHFLISTALACLAIHLIGRTVQRLLEDTPQTKTIIKGVYRAKIGVVLLFAAMPITLVLMYGFPASKDPGRCAEPVSRSGWTVRAPLSPQS